jgi:hypothetical protein
MLGFGLNPTGCWWDPERVVENLGISGFHKRMKGAAIADFCMRSSVLNSPITPGILRTKVCKNRQRIQDPKDTILLINHSPLHA